MRWDCYNKIHEPYNNPGPCTNQPQASQVMHQRPSPTPMGAPSPLRPKADSGTWSSEHSKQFPTNANGDPAPSLTPNYSNPTIILKKQIRTKQTSPLLHAYRTPRTACLQITRPSWTPCVSPSHCWRWPARTPCAPPNHFLCWPQGN